VVLRHNTRRI